MKGTAPDSIMDAIAERVSWLLHDHEPRPCCVRAILSAIPDGWAKVDGEWVRLKYGNWTTFAQDTDGNGHYVPREG